MNIANARLRRLQFLARIVAREIRHLDITDRRLFAAPFTREMAANLEQEVELAERLDASGKGLRLRTASIVDRLNENVPEKPSLRSRLTRSDHLTCDALPGTHRLRMSFPIGLQGA